MNLEELRYTKSHEWAHADGDVVTMGVSAFAIEQLTDLVHIDLPSPGTKVTAGEPLGEVESVKAVSDLYSPVDGEVVESNDALADSLEVLSDNPYEKGWMVKIKAADPAQLEQLMDHAAYQKVVESERD